MNNSLNSLSIRFLRAPRLAMGLLIAASWLVAVGAAAQTATFSVDSPSVTEGDSGSVEMTFTVTLSGTNTRNIAAQLEITGGTATSGTDYTATAWTNNRTVLVFNPLDTSHSVSLSVQGDTTMEQDETVVVQLSVSSGAQVGTGTGTGTILDDDPPRLSIDSPTVTEGDSGSANMTFTVSLNKASSQQITVDYADATSGTATSGTDYTAITGGTLTFAANATSQTFTVAVTGDTTAELDETVVVTLSNPSNAALSATASSGTGTITDNDSIVISISSPTVTERDTGSADLTFAVSLSSGPGVGDTVTVGYADAGTGTATSGTDYTALTAGTLTFTQGQVGQNITVTVTGDTLDEPAETIVVALSSPTGARLSTTASSGTGTITDNDDPPTLSIDSPTVTEGNSGSTAMTFTISLDAASGQNIRVWAAITTHSTATRGTDYTVTVPDNGFWLFRFAAGETSKTITMAVQGDTTDEADETVLVNLSAPHNAVIGTRLGTGTITDDDDGPTISINSPSVTEGNSGSADLIFTVSLDAASGQEITVDYADAGTGTATSGTDYTAITADTLTFEAGDTSKTITVAVTGDAINEADQTVVVELSNPTNATVSATAGSGTGTITDDDQAPLVYIVNNSPSVAEGDSGSTNLEFTVRLGGAAREGTATVDYADAGTGTAASGTDYTAITAGTLTFATGVTSQTITVAVTGDTADEPDETVVVTLSNPSNAVLASAASLRTRTGTIMNDDAGPTANAGPNQTVDEGDSVGLWGSATARSGGTLSYAWSQTGGSPTVTLNGATTLTPSFTAPNLAANVTLTFTLTVSEVSGGSPPTTRTGTSTVDVTVEADDDDPTANAGIDRRVREGDSITLLGSGSDPEGEAVSYSWAQTGGSPTVTLIDATTATPSFTAPELKQDATLTFTLTVTAGGASATDTANVIIRADNDPPTAHAGADQTVNEGNMVYLSGSGSDPEGDPVSYSWRQVWALINSRVTLTGANTATPSFTAPLLRNSFEMRFFLTVTAGGQSTTDVVHIWVENTGNQAPTANAGLDQVVNGEAAVSLSGSGSDPEGATLSYSWRQTGGSPAVTLTNPTTATPSFTAPVVTADATLTFSLTVTAGTPGRGSAIAVDTVAVVIEVPPVVSINSPSVAEGDSDETTDMTFRVSLNKASRRQVTVDYADAGTGTATAGTDYTAITAGTLNFAPNETEKSIVVSVTGDAEDERHETIVITLSNVSSPAMISVARRSGTGTIVNDDAPPPPPPADDGGGDAGGGGDGGGGDTDESGGCVVDISLTRDLEALTEYARGLVADASALIPNTDSGQLAGLVRGLNDNLKCLVEAGLVVNQHLFGDLQALSQATLRALGVSEAAEGLTVLAAVPARGGVNERLTEYALTDENLDTESAVALARQLARFVDPQGAVVRTESSFLTTDYSAADVLTEILLEALALSSTLDFDRQSGLLRIMLEGGSHVPVFIAQIAALPEGARDGIRALPDYSAFLASEDIGVFAAPAPLDPVGLAGAFEAMDLSLSIQANGRLEVTGFEDGATLSGSFGYSAFSGELSNIQIMPPAAGSDPASTETTWNISYSADAIQILHPFFVEMDSLFASLSGYGATSASFSRDSGLLTVNGLNFRPSYWLRPLTAAEQGLLDASADAAGLVYRAVDANGDGLTDYEVISAAGVQVAYRVAP